MKLGQFCFSFTSIAKYNLLKITLIASICFLNYSCSTDQQIGRSGVQLSHNIKKKITYDSEINYLIYLPKDYGKAERKWPLVLFLHGSGERGSDINFVKRNGPPKLVEEGKQFPFILVSPQCPENTSWDTKILIALLDEIESNYEVDKDRQYVTGLSMGGHGTWSLAIQYSERFAAIAPVCGYWFPSDVCKLKEVPIWAFHGEKDDIVPFNRSKEMINALQSCDSDVKFTSYPKMGHDAWTETYNNSELYDWLLSNSLSERKKNQARN